MKKYIILFVFFILCIHAFGQLGYRVGSKFIELSSDNSSLYFVQTKDANQMNRLQKDVKSDQFNNVKVIANLSDNACVVNSKTFGDGHYVSDIYKNGQGHKIIILPRIAIKMKEGYKIEDILTKFSKAITLDKKKVNLYLADCHANNAEGVLSINNEISKQEGVEWCEPMIIGEARKLNQLEGLQYYLKNVDQYGNPVGVDINVEPAWGLVTVDTTLVVAVVDDGVERDHDDLAGSVVDGYTIGYPNEKGEPINEFNNTMFTIYQNNTSYEELCSDPKAHGTACAGIIGARNDSLGIRGIASGVRILPINVHPQLYPIASIQYPTNYYESVGDAITWAYTTGNADIISCSIWFDDNTYISNALNNAMNYGRNGKGTVVVCASGNNPYYGVNFPADMPNTIAVGSVDNTGNFFYYSGRGTTLDLVAPSIDTNGFGNVVTTDRSEPKGYNASGDYVYDFGGSSAACPQVAGVVALMLSCNPNLTVDNVRSILRDTACKLPGMNGLNRTDDYGYGLVDAYAAVAALMPMIELYISISGPSVLCASSPCSYVISNLPSSYSVVWSINNSNFSITPSGNQCLVTYTGTPQYSVANLTAAIKWNGTTIKTLTKRIVMHGTDLVVYGEQESYYSSNGLFPYRSFTIPANNGSRNIHERINREVFADKESLPINFIEDNTRDPVHPPVDLCGYGITDINGGNRVYLNSNRFDGMDISFSGFYSPTYFYQSGGYVSFDMPYNSPNYPVTLHAQSDGHCHDFCLTFNVVPLPGVLSGDDIIWVNIDGSMLYVTFMYGGEPIGNGQYYFPSYSVTIFKIPSGTLVYSNTFSGTQTSFSVNTSTWTSGIYTIGIVCNGNLYSKSICL